MFVFRSFLFLIMIQFWAVLAAAQSFSIPPMSAPVIDQAGFLTHTDRQQLNQLIYDFNQRGVAQVQVLILNTLGDYDIETASIKIAEAYKLGDAKKDNGILFLIAAKEKRLRIEVGQGLEGAIPDITASRIIQNIVLPEFRRGNTSQGIVRGVYEILNLADAEFALPEHKANSKEVTPLKLIFYIIFFILFIFFSRFSGPFMGGGFGGGHRGGGGFGGGGFGGGGGWSGGGGGFSGGGSSGSW